MSANAPPHFRNIDGGFVQRCKKEHEMSLKNDPEPLLSERISVRIPAAVRLTGMSRSRIYQLMKDGELEFVKIGSSTIILVDSLKRVIESRRSASAGLFPSNKRQSQRRPPD